MVLVRYLYNNFYIDEVNSYLKYDGKQLLITHHCNFFEYKIFKLSCTDEYPKFYFELVFNKYIYKYDYHAKSNSYKKSFASKHYHLYICIDTDYIMNENYLCIAPMNNSRMNFYLYKILVKKFMNCATTYKNIADKNALVSYIKFRNNNLGKIYPWHVLIIDDNYNIVFNAKTFAIENNTMCEYFKNYGGIINTNNTQKIVKYFIGFNKILLIKPSHVLSMFSDSVDIVNYDKLHTVDSFDLEKYDVIIIQELSYRYIQFINALINNMSCKNNMGN